MISQRMIDEGARALAERVGKGTPDAFRGASEAVLRAALSGRPDPAPVTHLRVKPLEWRALAVTDREAAVADSILGKWEVWHFPNGSTYIMKPGEHQGTVYEDSYDEAKAYMERVYQRRIAPALTTVGQP